MGSMIASAKASWSQTCKAAIANSESLNCGKPAVPRRSEVNNVICVGSALCHNMCHIFTSLGQDSEHNPKSSNFPRPMAAADER